MASSLQLGQTLVGRTGISYHLQKVLYERGTESEGGMHRLWLALCVSSDLQVLRVFEICSDKC